MPEPGALRYSGGGPAELPRQKPDQSERGLEPEERWPLDPTLPLDDLVSEGSDPNEQSLEA
jgi:hypothetical protein